MLAVSAFTAPSVQAAMVTFDLAWSGASFSNTAVATGQITFDDTLNNASGFHVIPLSNANLTVTVSGASAGNGTFTTIDFASIAFIANQMLNFSQNLVGQTGFQDFNIFDAAGGNAAPSESNYFTISANSGDGNLLLLTSMTPHVDNVPEPTSFGLLGLGMVGLLLRRRRV